MTRQKSNLAVLFAAMAALLLASAGALFLMGRVSIAKGREVSEQQAVIDQINETLSTLKDAETGQRGYLLTGDERYMEPYHRAVSRIQSELAVLRADADAGELEPADVQQLVKLANEKIAEMDRTLAVLHTRGMDEALAAVRSDTGRLFMNEIRQVAERLIRRENIELHHTRETADHFIHARTIAFAVVILVNMGVGLLVYRQFNAAHKDALESGNILRLVMDAVPHFIFAKDREGRYRFVNQFTAERNGFASPEQMIGVSEEESAADKSQAALYSAADREVIDSGKSKFIAEEAVTDVSGITRIVQTIKLPFTLPGTTEAGVLGVSVDITARLQAEEALRESEEFGVQVISSIQEGLVVFDLELRYQVWNQFMEQITGVTADKVIGRHPDEIFPYMRERGIMAGLELSLAGQSVVHPDGMYQRPNGDEQWIATRTAPLRDAHGGVVGVIATVQDITLRKQSAAALEAARNIAEQAKIEAEDANRAKDHFLAVLSHELRTPLTPVLTTAQVMERDESLTAELRESAGVIRRNVELEARLIDDLLDLTRVSRGKLELHLATVDVHDKLQHVVQICNSDIQGAELNVNFDLQAERHSVQADPARLQQVFWNLLKNAVKFTPARGSITVATRAADDGRVEVSIRDTGVGISREVLPTIFKPFEQGGTEVTRLFGGLGLGLAISKGIIDLHAGELYAASDGKDRGSTFTVKLRTVDATGAEGATDIAHPEQTTAADGSPWKILLVEDHADTARAMMRLLKSYGYDIRIAATIEAAVQSATEPFDLLVSDIGLPDGSGLELMRRIRQQRSTSIKGIALSGFGTDEDVARSKAAGFTEHLIKPVNIDHLLAAVRRVLRSGVSGQN